MGQNDLGTCVILSIQDTKRFGTDLDCLDKVCELETPGVIGFTNRGIKRKLRQHIEKEAGKRYADLAVITCQTDFYHLIRTEIMYKFALYKYPHTMITEEPTGIAVLN